MKKTLCFLSIFAYALTAQSQNLAYKPFRLNTEFGASIPASSKVGVSFALEPRYALCDRFTVGLRIENAGFYYDSPVYTALNADYVTSYGVSGDYYFVNQGKRRVFAGAVISLFQYANVSVDRDTYKRTSGIIYDNPRAGFTPRVGVELGHLRLGAEYNFTAQTQLKNVNYFSVKAGIIIGGGRYNK